MMLQNEELSSKLRRTEGILSRVKQELANFRAANGRSPYINFDEEQRLNDKLKVSNLVFVCLYLTWAECVFERES